MNDRNKAWKQLTDEWDNLYGCDSCGWHASISEYDEDDLVINEKSKSYELPCLSKDDDGSTHRGLTVYY